MRRSTGLIVTVVFFALGGCSFAPPAAGGSAASGGPLGSGASSGTGTGLVSGGGASNGSGTGNVTGMNCAEVPQNVNRLPPDILLIQDKSGSMNQSADGTCQQNCGANSKWSQTTGALMTVLTTTDMGVNWGLKLFASPGGGSCTVNAGVEIPIAPNNATPINNNLAGQTPSNSTPTRLAVNAGTTYMRTLTDMNPKFLLLATDGLPNCIPGNMDNQASDMAGAVQAVTDALAAGFPTFVVGIATTSDPMSDATLTAMANAGGKPRAGTPSYYPVMNQQDLVDALNSIVSIAGSCIFTIPPPPNSDTDSMHIGVTVGGTNLNQDPSHTNGWDYVGTNQVEVYGPACNQIMGGTQAVIVFKCRIG
jgi:hypothetical protein